MFIQIRHWVQWYLLEGSHCHCWSLVGLLVCVCRWKGYGINVHRGQISEDKVRFHPALGDQVNPNGGMFYLSSFTLLLSYQAKSRFLLRCGWFQPFSHRMTTLLGVTRLTPSFLPCLSPPCQGQGAQWSGGYPLLPPPSVSYTLPLVLSSSAHPGPVESCGPSRRGRSEEGGTAVEGDLPSPYLTPWLKAFGGNVHL